MGRKPVGKPLVFFPVRVDEDVKAALLKLKIGHKTINEGLRAVLLDEFAGSSPAVVEGATIAVGTRREGLNPSAFKVRKPLLKPKERK